MLFNISFVYNLFLFVVMFIKYMYDSYMYLKYINVHIVRYGMQWYVGTIYNIVPNVCKFV